jgi:hypothetical protein
MRGFKKECGGFRMACAIEARTCIRREANRAAGGIERIQRNSRQIFWNQFCQIRGDSAGVIRLVQSYRNASRRQAASRQMLCAQGK